MSIAVFCIATNEFQAETIVIELKNEGFADRDISVSFPEKTGNNDSGRERQTKAPEGALAGCAALGIVGGILGWLAGTGALGSAKTSAFIAAGPVVVALAGLALGAIGGALIGAWVGKGISEDAAKHDEVKIDAGNILISVHPDDPRQAKMAKNIFIAAGAQDFAMTGEGEAPFSESRNTTHAVM